MGVGPRYCPSIEDKVVKFPQKERHQLFLEPEGWSTSEVYLNGMSTSLPEDAQRALVASIPGLENALLTRCGYAIEYDFCQPTQLSDSLECRSVPGLFLAGQINGTTGYEEAAAQGLYAGANAALAAQGRAPLGVRRDQGYLGVLVDDLIGKGVTEPYRMFTSRAEFRLQLREDNADARLTEIGRQIGLVDDPRWAAFNRKRDAVARTTEQLKTTWIRPETLPAADSERLLGKAIDHEYSLADLLRRPGIGFDAVLEIARVSRGALTRPAAPVVPVVSRETLASDLGADLANAVIEQVEIAIKYAGYISKQVEEVERAAHFEHLRLPEGLDYDQVPALGFEVRQTLNKHRPQTLGLASRMPGVTPAAISLLLVHLKKGRLKTFAKAPRDAA